MSPRTLVFRGKDRRCANGLKKALAQTGLHRRGGPGYTPYLLLRNLMESNITGTTPAIDVSIARQADRAAGYWRLKMRCNDATIGSHTTGRAGGEKLKWWSQAGSNRRPLACHASALPAELWPHAKAPETTQGRPRCQASAPLAGTASDCAMPLEFPAPEPRPDSLEKRRRRRGSRFVHRP